MQKVHLLSGATSGIGRAIYHKLRENGDAVIPIVSSAEKASSLQCDTHVVADFSKPAMVRKAIQEFELQVDSFINCAGIAIGKPIWENTDDEILNLMNINLLSPMSVIGELKKNLRVDSALILFSSKSAYGGGWDDAYIASKGGINALVKSLSLKYAPHTRVIGIAPGVTANTRMTEERKANDLDAVVEKTPLKRLASPVEIAELTHSLLGDAGRHITGAMIDINGGSCLR